MKTGNDFSVYTFSNASTFSYPENTLTQFTNNTPYRISLPTNENWYACVESVGFTANFDTIIPPNNNNLANIIISTTSNTYNEFLNGGNVRDLAVVGRIYFPEGTLTEETIKKSLRVLDDFDIEYNVTPNSYLGFYVKEGSEKFYCISIHENTMSYFQLSKRGMKKVRLADENYYYGWLTPGGGAVLGSTKNWYKQLPEVIKIECSEICEQIYNNQLTKDLNVFFPLISENMVYYFHEFLVRQYVKLSNCDISKISITLKDENNKNLPITSGVASFVKLNFKKMPYNYESFNVGVTSHEGEGCFFTSNMPRTYYLDSDWKVSLSSINFPNNFKPLAHEKSSRIIFYGNNKKLREVKKLEIPNLMWTEITLIAMLNETMQEFAHFTVGALSIYTFTLKKKAIISLTSSVCSILGFDPKSDKDYFLKKSEGYVFFNPSNEDIEIPMNNSFNIDYLKPKYMMLYADFIQPSIVGESYSKLLKIIQIPNNNANYHTDEFQHQETHSLENTLIKTMHFEIRSHTGELINFADSKNIFLNLLFSKNK